MDERNQQQNSDGGVQIEPYQGPMTSDISPPTIETRLSFNDNVKGLPTERFLEAPLALPPVPDAYLQEEVLPPRPTSNIVDTEKLLGLGAGFGFIALMMAIWLVISYRNPNDHFFGLGLMRQLMPCAVFLAALGLICSSCWAILHKQANTKMLRVSYYIIAAEIVLLIFTLLEAFGLLTI